jgi:hypothetical protein
MNALRPNASGIAIVLALLALPLSGHYASATLITRTYNFTASQFDGSPPQSIVIGSVTVTFDPQGPEVTDLIGNAWLNSINISFSPADIAYDYFPSGPVLFIGGIENGVASMISGTDDFTLTFYVDALGRPSFGPFQNATFTYTQITTPADIFGASSIEVSSVPEPATLGLMSVALAAFAFFGRTLTRSRTCLRRAPNRSI